MSRHAVQEWLYQKMTELGAITPTGKSLIIEVEYSQLC